jgi:hypothetical protein
MEGRTRLGIVLGTVYGALVLLGSVYQGFYDGALIVLATAALGIGGGLIAGGLLFANIALCPSEGKQKEEEPSTGEDEFRRAA